MAREKKKKQEEIINTSPLAVLGLTGIVRRLVIIVGIIIVIAITAVIMRIATGSKPVDAESNTAHSALSPQIETSSESITLSNSQPGTFPEQGPTPSVQSPSDKAPLLALPKDPYPYPFKTLVPSGKFANQ